MSKFAGKLKNFSTSRPNLTADWDDIYEQLKAAYADYIAAGIVSYDDRTKLFMIVIAHGWNEWSLLSYNLNRLAINSTAYVIDACPTARPTIRPPAGICHVSNQTVDIAAQINNLQEQIAKLHKLLLKTTTCSTRDE